MGRRGPFSSFKCLLPAFASLRGGVGSATCGREAKREAEEVAAIAVLAEVEMGEGGGINSKNSDLLPVLVPCSPPPAVVKGLHPVHRHISNPGFCISIVFSCELMSVERLD